MNAFTSLLSAIIGGILVLMGDGVRRRWEVRQATRHQLAEAATQLAVTYHRVGGTLSDARERGLRLSDIEYIEPDRFDVSTHLWTTPGSMQFLEPSNGLVGSWRRLTAAYDDDRLWQEAWKAHLEALHVFQASIRDYMGDK